MPCPGGLAAVGMHPVCNIGALRHVRRGHFECPDPQSGLWRQRPEIRRLQQRVQPVSDGLQPSSGGGGGRDGGGVSRADAGIFSKSASRAKNKAEVEEADVVG